MNKDCKHKTLNLKSEEARPGGWVRKKYICESCGLVINISVKGTYWLPIIAIVRQKHYQ